MRIQTAVFVVALLTGCASMPQKASEREKASERATTSSHSRSSVEYDEQRSLTLSQGREILDLVQEGDSMRLFARFTEGMAKKVPLVNVEALLPIPIKRIRSEGAVIRSPQERTYLAEFEVDSKTALWLTAVFDHNWRITGLLLQPSNHHERSDLKQDDIVYLKPPFKGEWLAMWGGEGNAENFHHSLVDAQRWALDFVIWKDGGTHRDPGKRNEDYWAWDQPILAPVSGVIVTAEESYDDNLPGMVPVDASTPAGNHVVIQSTSGRHVVLAHLKRGSIKVSEGQQVSVGAEIGRCGNSGNSSEPHLHIHVQDNSSTGTKGFPIVFGTLGAETITPQGGMISAM